MTTAVAPEAPRTLNRVAAPAPRAEQSVAPQSLARFAITAIQFGVLVSITRTFEIDNPSLYAAVKTLWIGWVLHHFLPMRLRLPFFATLSVAIVGQTMGVHDGAIVVGIGLALIGACHLPVRFGVRLAVVLGLAALLVALRAEWVPAALAGRVPPRVWPILGSMFMFRLIAYLYDLKHRAAPVGPWRAAAYFFMAPNACFPLFPVVDYKGFVRSHYAEDVDRTYQLGLRWMWRGILQLLAYQVVYLFWVTDPMQAASIGDVAWYAATTFLLYLRVSGLFHLIVGMLRMFGFALPETHHLYYLSSSFTDFWRRINIYWKEFLTKVVFYPAFVRLKRTRLGDARAMLAATLVAFAVTWFMHGYQLFWARGRFPITWQDVLFWFGLGALVMVNMRWEARHGRKRRLAKTQRTLRGDIALGARVAGTFAAICVLWAIWNTSSSGLRALAAASMHATPLQVLAIVGVLAAIGAAGVRFGGVAREGTTAVVKNAGARAATRSDWRETAMLLALSCALLAVGKWPRLLERRPALVRVVTQVEHTKFNRIDLLGRERGYYQDVNDALTMNAQAGRLDESPPPGWHNNPAKRLRDDVLMWDYTPLAHVTLKRFPFTVNRWGMRDHDYSRDKPAGTTRLAILGSSHEAGSGVGDDDTYENLTEARLRAEHTAPPTEILNFAVDGYGPLQKLGLLEDRVFRFSPDVVIYAVHSNELDWTTKQLEDLVSRHVTIPFSFMRDLVARAGVRRDDLGDDVQRKMRPFHAEILGGVFAELAADCRAHGAHGVVMLVEHANDPVRPASMDSAATLARAAGLDVIDLSGAFAGVADRDSLMVAPWDDHPNRLGHALLAKRLHDELLAHHLLDPRAVTTTPALVASARHPLTP